jgi:putative spermidine/putrescine transport system permease protein
VPILLPGILGVALSAFTLSYDEYARTTLTIGARNTLPLEIYALISSATTPMLFALGTLTTAVSFLLIGITLLAMLQMRKPRTEWASQGLK